MLEGARVRIESLGRSASTGRDGRFSLGQLPAGTHEVTVRYLGTDIETTSVTIEDNATARLDVVLGGSMDEIVVRGIRAGQASALNQQKSSDTIVRVVSADDIGALPDTNVAEAVQRGRDGGGPSAIEAVASRYYGHFEGDAQHYRDDSEIAASRAAHDAWAARAASTISGIRSTGVRGTSPTVSPVAGLMEEGPVEPKQLPREFTHTT